MIVSAYCVCSHIGYNQTIGEDNSGPSLFFVFFCFPRVSRDILMPICRAHCIMYSQNMSDDYSDPDSFFVVFCFPRVSCRRSLPSYCHSVAMFKCKKDVRASVSGNALTRTFGESQQNH